MGKISPELREMIEQQQLVFTATVGKDGVPNVSPKGSIRVWDENNLIFVERNSRRTRDNLKENSKIALVVLDKEKMRGFQIKGQVELIDKGPLFEQVDKTEKSRTPYRGPFNYVIKIAVAEVFPIPTPKA